jgi:hypothetical protein
MTAGTTVSPDAGRATPWQGAGKGDPVTGRVDGRPPHREGVGRLNLRGIKLPALYPLSVRE